jgi:peptide deformylase
MERGAENPPLVLINPRFTDLADESVEGREGCLSLPGYVSLKVPRATTVKAEALNQFLMPVQVEAHDFLARVIQHEYDHLDGILYIDRLRHIEDLELLNAEVRARNAAEQLFTGSPTEHYSADL